MRERDDIAAEFGLSSRTRADLDACIPHGAGVRHLGQTPEGVRVATTRCVVEHSRMDIARDSGAITGQVEHEPLDVDAVLDEPRGQDETIARVRAEMRRSYGEALSNAEIERRIYHLVARLLRLV